LTGADLVAMIRKQYHTYQKVFQPFKKLKSVIR